MIIVTSLTLEDLINRNHEPISVVDTEGNEFEVKLVDITLCQKGISSRPGTLYQLDPEKRPVPTSGREVIVRLLPVSDKKYQTEISDRAS